MGARLNPYLTFPGTARDAMQFYERVFGGDLSIMTFGEYGMEGPGSEGTMHAMLEAPNGFVLMASDQPPGMDAGPAGHNRIAVSLSGDDEAELRGYWDELAGGGDVTMPLEKQMWGDVFGMCTDRFGIPWMVNIAQPHG